MIPLYPGAASTHCIIALPANLNTARNHEPLRTSERQQMVPALKL
jgi:hypothetical protein